MNEGFKVGDRVVSLEGGDKGITTRLCADNTVVQVRWDAGMQQMVEVNTIKLEGSNAGKRRVS